MPVLPAALFWITRHQSGEQQTLQRRITMATQTPQTTTDQTDRLIIPGMLLDEPVHTGPTAVTLRQGLWLRPQGSTPDKGSNTVIVGHRFTYTNPRGALYHLDKVRVGDSVGLRWQDVMHTYRVTTIKTVAADATAIEAPTTTARLTIYTCTPLWLPKDRLVVIAEEIQS
jgi:sortase A